MPPSPLTSPGGGSAALFAGKDILLITGGVLAVTLAVVGITAWRRT